MLHILGGEAWSSQGHAVASLPVLLSFSVPHTILLVHHLLQQRQVICIQRRYWDVPHRSELTTVIQVFVLQTEKVPNKAPETWQIMRINYLTISSWKIICHSFKETIMRMGAWWIQTDEMASWLSWLLIGQYSVPVMLKYTIALDFFEMSWKTRLSKRSTINHRLWVGIG